jgi:hypothetical protein
MPNTSTTRPPTKVKHTRQLCKTVALLLQLGQLSSTRVQRSIRGSGARCPRRVAARLEGGMRAGDARAKRGDVATNALRLGRLGGAGCVARGHQRELGAGFPGQTLGRAAFTATAMSTQMRNAAALSPAKAHLDGLQAAFDLKLCLFDAVPPLGHLCSFLAAAEDTECLHTL